jgi:hypothetical protein
MTKKRKQIYDGATFEEVQALLLEFTSQEGAGVRRARLKYKPANAA